jgi:tetratricopeptide (TPR) repeat protein
MSRVSWKSLLFGLVAAFSLTGIALAANEGQDDLDQATQAKLNIKTLSDLGEVIRLSESALKKGLDPENTKFANQLLASTLAQRGTMIATSIFAPGGPDAQWRRYRETALHDFEKAVKLDPALAEVSLYIAKLNLLPDGDKKRASDALDKAIAAAVGAPDVRVEALSIRASLEKDPKKQIKDLDEAVRTSPNNAMTRRARCEVLAQDGQYEKALADADAALKIDSDHGDTLELKALILARMKKFKEADAVLAQAAKARPKSASPLIKKAQILAMTPDYPAALKALDDAAAIQRNNPAIPIFRATIYQAMKEDAKALAEIDKLLADHPDLIIALRLRSLLLAGLGRFDEAISQQEELVKDQPDDPEANTQLAMLYSAADKSAKAVELFNKVLKKTPDFWLAVRGRGDAYLSMGKHAEAIADFEKAYKANPKDSGLLNNFAWVLATSPDDKLRNGKRALEMATEACKLTDYKAPHILSTLGAACAETGDFETAKKWSKKAIEIAKADQRDALTKELESYQAKKPIRERKTGEKEAVKKPAPATPAELPKNSTAKPLPQAKSQEPPPKPAEKPASAPAKK